MSKPLIFVIQLIAAIFVFVGIMQLLDDGSAFALIVGAVMFAVARYGWKKRTS